ncbi:hypothetical protein [Commensalibacter papalotli (ex Servin-Garciduenas et al. 2014)]|uniref:Uncharacterized protein n=1 Tax=Commensalibacter papalotli (ex Servin-Garciduenas et al. 2014) TaxID=1208583 RepID=W7DM60_9PROT|nr:hypothetical protein [Commensalibacter papalotli (ex Servin-Garciduenas et al. 2014)]EUK18402.1 hypothetical protein COMX_01600 [Commensalibacter papalotli (ex Servin-Garciduenas et al. 2014)]
MEKQPPTSQQYINTAFQNPEFVQQLWCEEDKISTILSHAVKECSVNENNSPLSICCDYLIDYVCVYLVKKPSDFIYIFASFDQAKDKITFMNLYFQNYLTHNTVTYALLKNITLINEIGEYQYWIEYPLKFRATKLIQNASQGSLTITALFPTELDLPEEMKDYLLSWAFVENKLAETDIEYFRTHYARSYEMLKQAKQNNK